MNIGKFNFVAMIFALVLLLLSTAAADRIDQGDIPEIMVDPCGTSCQIKYVEVDTCWPGNTFEMPVYVLNLDTLTRIEFTLDCPSGFTFDSLNTTGSPWSGSIDIDTIGGTIYFDFEYGTDVLEYSASYRRLVDVVLTAASSINFGSSHTVDFDDAPRARTLGSDLDCIVDNAFSGQVTVPDDSVTLIIGPQTIYSYQASAYDDSCKDDYPVTIPISLYTNFPCSTYCLIIDKQAPLDWSGTIGFDDNYEAGCTYTPLYGGSWIKLTGQPIANMGNDYTLYLGDLKLNVTDFATEYNADSSFSDTFYVSLMDSYSGYNTFVYNWGDDDSLDFDRFNTDSTEMILPQYGIEFKAQDAVVNTNGNVVVPITLDPTFYSADYNIWTNFNFHFLTLDSIVAAGGQYPEIDTSWQRTDASPPRMHYQVNSDSLFQEAKFFFPDSQQTAFNMHFTVTDSFTYSDTMSIDFTDTSATFVYDWFSSNNSVYKIRRDSGDGDFWNTLSGNVTNPARVYQRIDGYDCEEDTVVVIHIAIDSLSVNTVYTGLCYFKYKDDAPVADDITSDMTIDSVKYIPFGLGYRLYKIYFNANDTLTEGQYLHVWLTDAGGRFSLYNGCSIQYDSGAKTVAIENTGGGLTYNWHSPKLDAAEPISISLFQNYPNPFNARTSISFNMGTPGFAELKVFDILGRQIKTLVSKELPAGKQIVNWDGTNAEGKQIAGGVYFYVLKAGENREVKKMLYLK